MSNLTVLFYTCNQKPEPFATNVRNVLLEAIGELPLISISHQPLDFGRNICIGESRISAYTLYQQVLIGAEEAKTDYIACTEDDVLYAADEFTFRPPDKETFCYNKNRWWIESSGLFRWRNRTALSGCVAPRQLMIDTLKRLFEKFPVHPETREGLTGFAEPGRYEVYLGLPQVNLSFFRTKIPIVTFNTKPSLGGLRKSDPRDLYTETLPYWGTARKLWDKLHGTSLTK